MAGFDSRMRREFWVFQESGTRNPLTDKPCFRRLPYNFVQYDDSPDRYLEPVADVQFSNEDKIMNPLTDGHGHVAGFEFVKGQPLGEIHRFDP